MDLAMDLISSGESVVDDFAWVRWPAVTDIPVESGNIPLSWMEILLLITTLPQA
jgi:hypothetical protein